MSGGAKYFRGKSRPRESKGHDVWNDDDEPRNSKRKKRKKKGKGTKGRLVKADTSRQIFNLRLDLLRIFLESKLKPSEVSEVMITLQPLFQMAREGTFKWSGAYGASEDLCRSVANASGESCHKIQCIQMTDGTPLFQTSVPVIVMCERKNWCVVDDEDLRQEIIAVVYESFAKRFTGILQAEYCQKTATKIWVSLMDILVTWLIYVIHPEKFKMQQSAYREFVEELNYGRILIGYKKFRSEKVAILACR